MSDSRTESPSGGALTIPERIWCDEYGNYYDREVVDATPDDTPLMEYMRMDAEIYASIEHLCSRIATGIDPWGSDRMIANDILAWLYGQGDDEND